MSNIKTRDLKPHIGIFGRRNTGKSSLINTLTGQMIAIVSEIPGTTTDPVKRSVEILGFAPVIFIDTAGIDDEGTLGEQRIKQTKQIFSQIDLALLLITDNIFTQHEEYVIEHVRKNDVPLILIFNKSDAVSPDLKLMEELKNRYKIDIIPFSNEHPNNMPQLIELIKSNIPESSYIATSLLGDIINKGDVILLVNPIDTEAPAGRLILPQVQILRDLLDNHAISIVVQPEDIQSVMSLQIKPKLIITDSQLLNQADEIFPDDIPLTGYSIILARHKGFFSEYLKGTPKIDELKDGDRILILESCSHHQSCEDIGRHKIPQWLSKYTGKNLHYDFVAGLSLIDKPVTDYSLVIQCGGCMITRKQLNSRLKIAIDAKIPITNYGLAIAYLHGYYKRVVKPFC